MSKRPPEELPCPQCGSLAKVILDEAKRYTLRCIVCGYDNYLKIAAHQLNQTK